jgi:hypothetical protein
MIANDCGSDDIRCVSSGMRDFLSNAYDIAIARRIAAGQ